MIDIDDRLNSFDDDITDTDDTCPHCGHYPTRSRSCTSLHCEDGFMDLYEEDAINYAPGEEYEMCEECHGFGVLHWCPNCGVDLNLRYPSDEEEEEPLRWRAMDLLERQAILAAIQEANN